MIDEKKTDMVYYNPHKDITITVEKGNVYNLTGDEERVYLGFPVLTLTIPKTSSKH